jgi:hypothetical protein
MREIFQARFDKLPKQEQEKLLNLRSILLSFGGEDLVILDEGESEIDEILASSQVFETTYKRVRGTMCHCHENVIVQKEKYPHKYRIATGYALSSDGLWRQHSWLVDKKNRTYETTMPRLLYYGFIQA